MTFTLCPGFSPVIVAVAEFFDVDVEGFVVITAFDGTLAAAAFAAVATFAATDAAATALAVSYTHLTLPTIYSV